MSKLDFLQSRGLHAVNETNHTPVRQHHAPKSSRIWAFCSLVALVEGFDLQSLGLAAPRIAAALGFAPRDLALVFTGNTVGMLMGAMIGGRLSDRFGRKALLIASLTVFGAFSFGTSLTSSLTGLSVMRLLTGLGLGGAFPALIALVAETGESSGQAGRVAMVSAGMPLGGAIAGLLVYATPGKDWTLLFEIGGLLPFLLACAGTMLLPSVGNSRRDNAPASALGAHIGEILFGEGRFIGTLALWASSFCTLLILHLLLNWLPTLMIGRGFGTQQGMIAAIAFSVGGATGAIVLGYLGLRRLQYALLGLAYCGVAVGLLALSSVAAAEAITAWSGFAGFCLIGAQFLLYGMSATLYPLLIRGSGVGAAVAAGRLGAIAGPLLGGAVLASGAGASQVLTVLLPLVGIALLAIITLAHAVRLAVRV